MNSPAPANGKAHSRITSEQTSGYRPTVIMHPYWLDQSMPPFTIWVIERMRIDPQVKLCTSVRTAPLMRPIFEVSGDKEVTKFVSDTLRAFWTKAIRKVAKAMVYTLCGGEILYEWDEQKSQFRFRGLSSIYPTDLKIRSLNGRFTGLRVRMRRGRIHAQNVGKEHPDDVILRLPKAFLYLHNREFGAWTGRSIYESAYKPWFDKAERDGGYDIRRLWYYKCAFDGGDIYHPEGNYVDPDTEMVIPYQDIARQIMEMGKTGGVYAFPNSTDANGQRKWERRPPAGNGSGGDILGYIDSLDVEISRGLEVPDDIISQQGGTGSYSGRAIPLAAFMAIANETLTEMVSAVDEFVIAPLVRMNFGSDRLYEIMSAKVDVNAFTGEQQQQQPGDQQQESQPPDGQQPQEGGDQQPEMMLSRIEEVHGSDPLAKVIEHLDRSVGKTNVGFTFSGDELHLAYNPNQKRAPIGGINIRGTFYPGGRWIPPGVFDKATPEQQTKIEKATKGFAPPTVNLPKLKLTDKEKAKLASGEKKKPYEEHRHPTDEELEKLRKGEMGEGKFRKPWKVRKTAYQKNLIRNYKLSKVAEKYESPFRSLTHEIMRDMGIEPGSEENANLTSEQKAELLNRIVSDKRYWENAPERSEVTLFGPEFAAMSKEEQKAYSEAMAAKVDMSDNVGAKYAVAKHLSKRAAEHGKLDWRNPQEDIYNQIVDGIVHDTIYNLNRDPDSQHWYEDQVERSITAMGLIHPELNDDDSARQAGFFGNDSMSPSDEARKSFLAILAITSNGQTVMKHFHETVDLFDEFKKSKKFGDLNVKWAGTTASGMRSSFRLLDKMVSASSNSDVMEFLSSPMTVRELRAWSVDKGVADRKKAGTFVSGELADEKVYGAMIFGPKIGSFLGNMDGRFGTLTQDRWLTRAMEGRAGTAVDVSPSKIRQGVKNLKEILSPKMKKMVLGEFAPDAKLLFSQGKAAFARNEVDPNTEFGQFLKWVSSSDDHPLQSVAKKAISGDSDARSSIQRMAYSTSGHSDKEKYIGFDKRQIQEDMKLAETDGRIVPGSELDRFVKEKLRIYTLGGVAEDESGAVNSEDAPKSYLERTLSNVAAKRLRENAYPVNEAPRGASERSLVRQMANDVQARLAELGLPMSTSSFQAVDWYHPKRLYGLLGAGVKRIRPADYEAASLIALRDRIGEDGLSRYSQLTGLDSDHIEAKLKMTEEEIDEDGTGEEGSEDDE